MAFYSFGASSWAIYGRPVERPPPEARDAPLPERPPRAADAFAGAAGCLCVAL